MLVLTRRRGERLLIGEEIAVELVEIRGDKVRLGIEAPKDVRIDREEVRERVLREGAQKGPQPCTESQALQEPTSGKTNPGLS